MRIFALAILAVGAASAAQPATAQTYDAHYPVCMHVFGDPTYFECRYTSIAQCQGTAAGRSAECIANPYFAGGPARSRNRAY